MSILEVMFAILVTAIGLLGAVAVLPVASTVARNGRTKDTISVHGISAVHQFDTQGYRSPNRWVKRDNAKTPPYDFVGMPSFGFSYCIDPRFFAANDGLGNATNNPYQFPYVNTPSGPRMARVTLLSGLAPPYAPSNKPYMLSPQAESIFTFDDDLNFERPGSDRSLEARQLFDTFPADDALAVSAKRQGRRGSIGNFSWLATLVPKLDRYTNPNAIFNDQYVLSVVVFHQRPAGLDMDGRNERIVNVAFPGLGVTGGEVRLYLNPSPQTTANTEAAEIQLKLKPGDWLMLGGNTQHVTAGTLPIFQWYRVADCDHEVNHNGSEYERYATLMGQDWSITPVQATLIEGVAGLYDKTIRLYLGQ